MQTTFDYPGHQRSAYKLPVILLALMLIVWIAIAAAPATGLLVNLSAGHAVERHGTSALAVRECLEQRGPMLQWQNPANGRVARVCQLSPTTWGIQIIQQSEDGRWNEITSFIKSRMSRIEQVIQYLKNSGYQP